MIRTIFCLMIALSIACFALGQVDRGKKSDEIVDKARQLDLMNHIIPLILTKDQLKKLLPAIEKGRQKVKEIQNLEYQDLSKYESKIDKAISDGFNKDLVPGRDLLVELNKLFRAFAIRRQIAAGENAELVLEALKATLNEGQRKAAANSLDPKAYDPKAEPAKMSEDDKLKLFIKDVLLDTQAYEMLVKMSR